jgi:hypothetical protein
MKMKKLSYIFNQISAAAMTQVSNLLVTLNSSVNLVSIFIKLLFLIIWTCIINVLWP